jgi:hypothetical protein
MTVFYRFLTPFEPCLRTVALITSIVSQASRTLAGSLSFTVVFHAKVNHRIVNMCGSAFQPERPI